MKGGYQTLRGGATFIQAFRVDDLPARSMPLDAAGDALSEEDKGMKLRKIGAAETAVATAVSAVATAVPAVATAKLAVAAAESAVATAVLATRRCSVRGRQRDEAT